MVRGRNLTRTSSHRKALMKNLATSLFEHKSIVTTEAKAKELRPYAEKLITKARVALQKEKLGTLPSGQTIDIHSRRIVGRHIRNKAVLQELFDTIAPAVAERNGGYTRIVKLGFARGDAAREAIIQLVDFGPEQDGQVSLKRKKASAKKKTNAKAPKAPKVSKEAKDADTTSKKASKAKETIADKSEEVVEKVEEVKAQANEVIETAEAKAETTVNDVVEDITEEAKEISSEENINPEDKA